MMKSSVIILALSLFVYVSGVAGAAELQIGARAPGFQTKTHAGAEFDLASRKGQWTVLYFYPKADTPGCTKQACTFRDNIHTIRDQGADVFGVSADTIQSQAKFHEKHKLNFILLADPNSKVIEAYGTKMPGKKMSQRWTFLLDPDLRIRAIEKDVDPVKDAERMAALIRELKLKK